MNVQSLYAWKQCDILLGLQCLVILAGKKMQGLEAMCTFAGVWRVQSLVALRPYEASILSNPARMPPGRLCNLNIKLGQLSEPTGTQTLPQHNKPNNYPLNFTDKHYYLYHTPLPISATLDNTSSMTNSFLVNNHAWFGKSTESHCYTSAEMDYSFYHQTVFVMRLCYYLDMVY